MLPPFLQQLQGRSAHTIFILGWRRGREPTSCTWSSGHPEAQQSHGQQNTAHYPQLTRAGATTCAWHLTWLHSGATSTFRVQINHRHLEANEFLGSCSSLNLFLGIERRQSGFCWVRLTDLPCCIAEHQI